jgi:Rad3-related DNA helicase
MLGRDAMKRKAFVSGPIQGMETRQSYLNVIREICIARAKAMEYANGIPCLNALAQSAGRLLRSPEDKGIIVMMNGRAAGRFKQRIPKDWREDMTAHYNIEKILEGIKNFTADNARNLQKRK